MLGREREEVGGWGGGGCEEVRAFPLINGSEFITPPLLTRGKKKRV